MKNSEHSAQTISIPDQVFEGVLSSVRRGYSELNTHDPKARFARERHGIWVQHLIRQRGLLQDRGICVPERLLTPYQTPLTDLVASGLPVKYQIRPYNTLLALLRVHQTLPELLKSPPRSILDMSAGACGMAEVLGGFGHSVTCSDHMAGSGAQFIPIHQELDIRVTDFDGQATTWPFGENSFDVLTCFQAANAYGSAEEYPDIVSRLARIARQKVVVIFNREASSRRLMRKIIRDKIAPQFGNAVQLFDCCQTEMPGLIIDL